MQRQAMMCGQVEQQIVVVCPQIVDGRFFEFAKEVVILQPDDTALRQNRRSDVFRFLGNKTPLRRVHATATQVLLNGFDGIVTLYLVALKDNQHIQRLVEMRKTRLAFRLMILDVIENILF